MRSRLVGFLGLAACAGLGVAAAPAGAILFTRHLSADLVDDAEPRISGDRVVWQKGTGASADVWLWDAAPPGRMLSSNASADESPDLDGDLVVWQAFDGLDFEIVRYDLVAGSGSTLSANGADDVLPVVSGGNIAWQQRSGASGDIVLYPTPGTALSGDLADDTEQRISGAQVAWTKDDAGDQDVWAWFPNLPVNPGSYQLADTPDDDHSPAISGEKVVFVRGTGAAAELYRYDPRNFPVVRITTDGVEDAEPQIDGSRVVWTRDDGAETDIYRWTEGGVPQPITSNSLDDHSPRIDGEDVVWVAEEATGPEIWACFACFSGGTPERVSHYVTEVDRNPRIDAGRIVWENCTNAGTPSEECDILMAAPEPGAGAAAAAALAAVALLRARRASVIG